MLVLLLPAVVPVRAQCGFVFPSLQACPEENCNILIDVRPRGVARVLRDNEYGTRLGIDFGAESVFDLGDNGRLSFGNTGGIQALRTGPFTVNCLPFPSGLIPYEVDLAQGGSLYFSGNNRFELNPNNIFTLSAGSKIDGRLDIESQGAMSMISTGGITMPNLDISAPDGITIFGQGDIQIGDLENRNESSENNNRGINISADGDVEIGIVDGNGELSVIAGGDINIEEIENMESISLTISPPEAGIITIGGRQAIDNPVMCAPPDDCNGFEPDEGSNGGGGEDECEPVNEDGSANECAGGGTTGIEFVLLCMAALFGKRRIRLDHRAG
jgi:hypothetical protein